ncbi:hypothetical protein FVE85_5879 [Porphyridium purpureum]|uniref:Uncharacterized protein n=1 Tax=Porphyridium purpureum TaxID=35688 RepID=A0A5J4Z5M1_PORPP|nr:hypothetical protein FVE85_5879 [Porphyridium purpureum]|eukprot:POR2558..scf295_1
MAMMKALGDWLALVAAVWVCAISVRAQTMVELCNYATEDCMGTPSRCMAWLPGDCLPQPVGEVTFYNSAECVLNAEQDETVGWILRTYHTKNCEGTPILVTERNNSVCFTPPLQELFTSGTCTFVSTPAARRASILLPAFTPAAPSSTPSPTPTPVCIEAEWIEARGLQKVHANDGIGELLCITGLDELPCGTPDHILEVTIDGRSSLRTYAEVCAERECLSKVGRFNGVLHMDSHKMPTQHGLRVTTVSYRGTVWSDLENRIVVAAQTYGPRWVHSGLTYLQRRNSAVLVAAPADE